MGPCRRAVHRPVRPSTTNPRTCRTRFLLVFLGRHSQRCHNMSFSFHHKWWTTQNHTACKSRWTWQHSQAWDPDEQFRFDACIWCLWIFIWSWLRHLQFPVFCSFWAECTKYRPTCSPISGKCFHDLGRSRTGLGYSNGSCMFVVWAIKWIGQSCSGFLSLLLVPSLWHIMSYWPCG